MQSLNVRPTVYDFTDYRSFLKAFYDWKKSNDNRYSNAVFAERAGLKSRSYLRLVLTGKRNLSGDAIPKFITGCELDRNESEAFQALVNFNQATTHESRKMYWEQFLNLKPRSKKAQRIHDEYRFLARMGYPILLILIRQPHVTHDVQGLSHLTGLTPKQVEEGLQTLEGLGAIRRLGDKFVTSTFSFETTNDMPNIATQTFHKNMLLRAAESVSLPVTEREYRSVLMPLNKEEFHYIQKRLRDLSVELDERFNGARPNSEKIYALNMNLIPITPDFVQRAKASLSQQSQEESKTQEKVL